MTGQRSLYVQQHLLGFGSNTTRHQLAVRILTNLTGKEKKTTCPCGFGVGITHAREGSVVIPGNLCRIDTGGNRNQEKCQGAVGGYSRRLMLKLQ